MGHLTRDHSLCKVESVLILEGHARLCYLTFLYTCSSTDAYVSYQLPVTYLGMTPSLFSFSWTLTFHTFTSPHPHIPTFSHPHIPTLTSPHPHIPTLLYPTPSHLHALLLIFTSSHPHTCPSHPHSRKRIDI